MRAPEISSELSMALLGALAEPSPERALTQTLLALEAAGLSQVDAQSPAAWLVLEVRGRVVGVACPDEHRSKMLEATVRRALGAALLRAAESDERARLQERFDLLSSASFEGILIHVDGDVIDANARVAELLRCTPQEVLGRETMLRCVAPEDLPFVLQRLRERTEGDYVITGVRKDGTRFRAEFSSKQGKLGDRPVRIVAVRDVTERERTDAQLRESEERLRELMAAAFDIFVVSRDNIAVEVGGRPELLGYQASDIVGKNVFEFLAPSVRGSTERLLAEGRVGAYESTLIDARGEPIPVEVCGVFALRDGERVRVSGVRDLRPLQKLQAERFKLQQQLERSQRLESLGVLAGGIAHDFNNLLVAVLGNADLLCSALSNEDDRECALAIRTAGERAAELVRQMLAYAGQREPTHKDPVDVAALLRELHTLLGASLSKKAELVVELEPGCSVLGDRASLSQVLMNLLTNASDALGESPGTLRVSARRIQQPDSRWDDALGAAIHPGQWILIEVSDTGGGMDEATRVRVFEPFFTTKPRGHGLGLAACLGIVSSHGGAILVESELGQGSRFSLLLPAVEPALQEAVSPARPTEVTAGRVLVIDDEQVVRAHLRRALTLRGYSVTEAECGTDGLRRLDESTFDVVLLDLTMGDMDGLEVIRRVRQGGSSVPIVLSSGYLDAESERELAGGGVQALLRKPYLVADLLAALERARAVPSTGM